MSASEKDWVHVVWNNRDIRIDKMPIFTKTTMSREYFISVSSIYGFEKRVVVKYETERLISADSETTDFFKRKWFLSLKNFV